MKKVKFKLSGIRPLFFHAFKIEAISNLSKVKSGSAGNDPEEWKRTVLEINDQLYIPASYWTGCLKKGSTYTKAGRGTLQKSFVSSTTVLTEKAMIDRYLPKGWMEMSHEQMETDSSKPVYLDIRGVTNPNSKGKNIRYRVACCPGWQTEVEFIFDDTIISQNQIKKIVEDSGKNIGVGDALALGYGRFKPTEFEITEAD